MYKNLVRHLREDMDTAMRNGDDDFWRGWIAEAADAIEELSAHYCPHMIRNVHDRGDDSLCRVLMAEVPNIPASKDAKTEEDTEPWLCLSCRHYPPSSTDGKPCSQCNPIEVWHSCYDPAEEEE